jgi:hypothetical protein
VIILRKIDGQGTIYRMSLYAAGRLDGKATLTLMRHNKPYKVAHARNGVGFTWGGDWYADIAELRYEPIHVKTGSIVFRYRFHDVK